MKNEPDDLLAAPDAGPQDGLADDRFADNGALLEAFEADLRRTLHHRDAPAGFADRLVARALAGERAAPVLTPGNASLTSVEGKLRRWPERRLWLTGAIAAALIAGLFGGEVEYRRFREQQRRVAEATRQFQTTERVTVRALAQAREQLQRAGVPLNLD